MLEGFVHDMPASRVVFAPGALKDLAGEVARLGARRAMLISGGHERGDAERVHTLLGSTLVSQFSDVVMHVPRSLASRAVEQARATDVDLVIALGGGSATGFAKAVALETDIDILAIPTTYAGSEMTPIWGITEDARKVTGRDVRVLPKTVVYDPELTLSLPAQLSAASGMNALAHLVEGLYAPELSPISALVAAEGVHALASSLPRVVADPADLDARSDALYGAWLAGWILGTTGMGVHHKIAHVLGGTFNLPHAPTHSAVLSYATAFNEADAPAAMAAIRQSLANAGFEASTAAGGIWDLAHAIGAPTSLGELGFSMGDVELATELVVAGKPVNPRAVEADGVRAMLAAAITGNRPESELDAQ